MKQIIRRALAALLLIAGITPAIAQTFPTVPSQTVIGRLGTPGTSGPSQAIPFATFTSQLLSSPVSQNITNPTVTFPFPGFNGDRTTNTYTLGISAIHTWTGSTTNGGTAIGGQVVVTNTATVTGNGGEVGGLYGGALNQKPGANPYGILGTVYNDSNASSDPRGNAIWAIVRGASASGTYTNAFHATSEASTGQHPHAGLLVDDQISSGIVNEFTNGVKVLSALTHGFVVGTEAASCGGACTTPTYPFIFYSAPTVRKWSVDSVGNTFARQFQSTVPVDTAGAAITDGTVTLNLTPSSNNTHSGFIYTLGAHPLLFGTNSSVWTNLGTTGTWTWAGAAYTVANGILQTNVSGAVSSSNTLPAHTISGAITYGGVTLTNAVTGTGSMVLSTSPTLTTPILGTAAATVINVDSGATTPSMAISGSSANTAISTYYNGVDFFLKSSSNTVNSTIAFDFRTANAGVNSFAAIGAQVTDVTAAAVKGKMFLGVANGTGAASNFVYIEPTGCLNVGTDSDCGAGGISATAQIQSGTYASIGTKIRAAGSAPTVTAGCNGAGSSISGSDLAGTVVGQTAAATTCTITFNSAYASAPYCTATGLSSPLTGAITPSTGTLVVNFASTANYSFNYHCIARSGG